LEYGIPITLTTYWFKEGDRGDRRRGRKKIEGG